MKRRNFIKGASIAAVSASGMLSGCTNQGGELKTGEVYHTVIFDLKYPVGSEEAMKFLEDGKRILTAVPGVIDFCAYRQCSPKNDYQYGFFMKFKNRSDFDSYTANPDHCKFVAERWEKEVTRFQESDFEKL